MKQAFNLAFCVKAPSDVSPELLTRKFLLAFHSSTTSSFLPTSFCFVILFFVLTFSNFLNLSAYDLLHSENPVFIIIPHCFFHWSYAGHKTGTSSLAFLPLNWTFCSRYRTRQLGWLCCFSLGNHQEKRGELHLDKRVETCHVKSAWNSWNNFGQRKLYWKQILAFSFASDGRKKQGLYCFIGIKVCKINRDEMLNLRILKNEVRQFWGTLHISVQFLAQEYRFLISIMVYSNWHFKAVFHFFKYPTFLEDFR